MKVAASPQSINRAMPEGGIQVTSHQPPVTSHQSLATSQRTCYTTVDIVIDRKRPPCLRGGLLREKTIDTTYDTTL